MGRKTYATLRGHGMMVLYDGSVIGNSVVGELVPHMHNSHFYSRAIPADLVDFFKLTKWKLPSPLRRWAGGRGWAR